MPLIRTATRSGLALSLALAVGCTAANQSLTGAPAAGPLPATGGDGAVLVLPPHRPPAPEVLTDPAAPPLLVDAIPPGQAVRIPQGRAALTIYVALPRRVRADGDRAAQYVDFDSIRQVRVTITGENLASPVQTTINVSSGTSASGTVILNAGRNQIITAEGIDYNGRVVAAVKGVATTEAGRVADVTVMYGTTPTAEALGGLDPGLRPLVNTRAVDEVVAAAVNPPAPEPEPSSDGGGGGGGGGGGASPTPAAGGSSYVNHPLFIDHGKLASALAALDAEGADLSAIASADIIARVGTDAEGVPDIVLPPGEVQFVLRAPSGEEHVLAESAYDNYPSDQNGDGVPDGAALGDFYYAQLGGVVLDPLSYGFYMYEGKSSGTVSGIPPGTFGYLTNSYSRISALPWIVLPPATGTVTVTPGETALIDLGLVDVSRPAISSTGGTFSSSPGDHYGPHVYEWYRFDTAPDTVYTVSYLENLYNYCCSGSQLVHVFDKDATQLFQAGSSGYQASGSFVFASAASNTLYVYLPAASTSVDVTAQQLGEGESLMKATVDFGR